MYGCRHTVHTFKKEIWSKGFDSAFCEHYETIVILITWCNLQNAYNGFRKTQTKFFYAHILNFLRPQILWEINLNDFSISLHKYAYLSKIKYDDIN